MKESLRRLAIPASADRRSRRRNLLLSGCFLSGLILAPAVVAQIPMTATTPVEGKQAPAPAVSPPMPAAGTVPLAATKAVAQLFENVAFWTQRGQPTIAVQDLERAIALAPPDADTLALAARLNFQLDRYEAADAYRLRLQKLAPNDPRLPALAAEQRRTPEELRILAEARRLTASGRKDEAIKSYQKFFKNNQVPDSLAIEYYTILGTTSPEGFKIATDEMPKVASRWPGDASFRLASAQLLTFQENTRSMGISQLAELTKVPIVAAGARVAWHDALLWQGADINSRDQIDLYLKENPSDPQLEAKRKEIQDSLPDEGLLARMRAYEDGAAGRQEEAEKGFLDALRIHPDDSEAMIMLSIIRRKQERLKESDALIAKAFEISPDRKEEFIGTIGFDPDTLRITTTTSSGGAGSQQSAAFNRQVAADYARIKSLTDQGKFDEAEKQLRKLTGRNWNTASYLSLGYIQKQAGKLPEAEASFRSALKSDPRNGDVMVGLATVLAAENKPDEVEGLYAKAKDIFTKQRNKNGLQVLARVQSDRMRLQAQSDADPSSAIKTFRAALDIDPQNPWLRLDLARALQKQGSEDEARKLISDSVNPPQATTDTLQAAIIFNDQIGNLEETNRLIARLPSNDRTSQMRDAQARLNARTQVQQAINSGPGARDRVLALASQPDPNGIWLSEIGRGLQKARDRATLRDAVAAAVAATPEPTPQQRLVYAGLLLGSEQTNEAVQMVAPLDRGALETAQQKNLDQVLNGIALQQSERLARRGKGREAATTLEPRLSAQPDDTDLQLGLSRAYVTSGKTDEAVELTGTLLKTKPDDLNVRIASIDAAIAAGDSARAQDLVAKGIERFPDDAQLYVRSANLKLADGHKTEALADFKKARDLRAKQLSR